MITREEAGYPVACSRPGGPVCTVCRKGNAQEKTCAGCAGAISQKTIPAYIVNYPAGYYTEDEMRAAFNLTPGTIDRFVQAGLLKERIIPLPAKQQWRIFLLKDNKGFLPPHKRLRRGRILQKTDSHCNDLSEYGIFDFIEKDAL